MTAKLIAYLVAAVVLLGGSFYAGHHFASLSYQAEISKIQAADAQALAKAQADARAKEQLAADTLAHIQAQNEQDKADAQVQYEKDVADLRTGALRLRKQWQCPASPSVPKSSTGPSEPDAAADDRAESAARVVRAAAEADATIKALQQIVITDRSMQ